MALRKALSYSKKHARPYTRNSRKKNRAYIKTVPPSKLGKYNFGSQKDYQDGKHAYKVSMVAEQYVQIRDNALEASRMLLHKLMEEKAIGNYFMRISVHPHHLIRENKLGSVAGADRVSTGMTQSFGVVIGRSALVKAGTVLFFVTCKDERTAQIAKAAFRTIMAKVPGRTRVVFEKVKAFEKR
ncbi:MAG: 50S ribosomal protein L16 [archaeon]